MNGGREGREVGTDGWGGSGAAGPSSSMGTQSLSAMCASHSSAGVVLSVGTGGGSLPGHCQVWALGSRSICG